ncbi:MAG: arginyltransferase [Phycisphaeraceae bacterium]|nr:arginyltransferase [Phycisphaeraceae bacterium]
MTGLAFFPFTPRPWPARPVRLPLLMTGEFACPYLPDQTARNQVLFGATIDGEAYHDLMDAGFRRSGTAIYRPACPSCRACRPIRVPVAQFAPGKSQRRCRRHNADLTVTVDTPSPSDEKFALYRRYIERCHQGDGGSYESFVEFLYRSPMRSLEFSYRDGAGRLLAVGICDVCARSLSSVYLYRDPDQRKRGLGTFAALWEIDYCRRHGIGYYYLGYWIRGSRKMAYKADFRPYELLDAEGNWIAGA